MTLATSEKIQIGRQTAAATAVAATVVLPVTPGSSRFLEQNEALYDRGRRGIDAMDFKAVQGVGRTEITMEGIINVGDTDSAPGLVAPGFLIANILNLDSYTAVDNGGTTAFDHFLKMGSAKTYLTIERALLGAGSENDYSAFRCNEFVLRWDAGEGLVTWTANGLAKLPTAGTTLTSLSDLSGLPHRGWEAIVTFDGNASFARLISGEWTFRRELVPFFSAENSQDFKDLYLGPLEVTCSVVLDFSVVIDLTVFRSRAQQEFTVIFTQGTADAASERSIGISCIAMDWGDAPVELDISAANVRLGLTGRGLYSTGNGGLSGSAQNGPAEVQITQASQVEYTT